MMVIVQLFVLNLILGLGSIGHLQI